ncbi:MAG: hypothetical protein I4O49_11935 [Janthinobacterium lividum]|nr:hypothetical protein [Janthinobacterium lividum]
MRAAAPQLGGATLLSRLLRAGHFTDGVQVLARSSNDASGASRVAVSGINVARWATFGSKVWRDELAYKM